MVIDIHTHLPWHKIFSPGFVDGVSSAFFTDNENKNALIKKMVRAHLKDESGEKMVQLLDEAGIDKAVLLIADFGLALGEAPLTIEEIHELHAAVMQAFPDRFLVFGGVDPRRGKKGVDLFERYVRDEGFHGLKIYPPCGYELDDEGLMPLYEICQQYQIPILTHTGPSLKVMQTEQRYEETVLKVTDQFKDVKFILGHGAAWNWRFNLNVAMQRDNVFLDMSTFQTFEPDPKALSAQFRVLFDHIPDQVLFGTDWPMFVFSATPKTLIDQVKSFDGLNDSELEKLFSKNAQRVIDVNTHQPA